MKFLGVDYGEKRVGLAVSTRDEELVLPYKTIYRLSKKQITDEIKCIVEELCIDAVVVGIPGDNDSNITRQIKNFIGLLRKKISIPIYTVNEELSSYIAEDNLKRIGVKSKKIKKVVDQIAAQEILLTYLREKKNEI